MDVDHLDGGEFFERAASGEPRRQSVKPALQGDVEAICKERNEDMSFDAVLQLVIDGPQAKIVLERLESRFDLGQLNIELPQLGGLLSAEMTWSSLQPFLHPFLLQNTSKSHKTYAS